MTVEPLEIRYYQTAGGRCPYLDWFNSLGDAVLQQTLSARITRVERGLLGEINWIGNGVFELKFRTGPGIRIYCGRHGKRLIILLCAGDKGTQWKDIERALRNWHDYLMRS